MNTNNLFTEISLLITSALLIVGGVFLLFFGKIDFTGLTLILGIVAALHGVNTVAKAPSPSQQAQLGNLQQNLQQILQQVLNLFPGLVQTQQTPPVQVIQNEAPAQQKAPEPILFAGMNQPARNINATASNASIPQQVSFPPAQVQQIPFPTHPQAIPSVNLANIPPAQQDTTRHFGDSQIIPVVPSNQQ